MARSSTTGKRQLRAEDLPLNQWHWVAVTFDHPGGTFESRVQWSGTASSIWTLWGFGIKGYLSAKVTSAT